MCMQGADFPNVQLIINFLAPESNECWVQRAGRGARAPGVTCRAVIMATPKILSDARDMCLESKIDVNPKLLLIKMEDCFEGEGEPDEPSSQAEPQVRKNKDKKTKSRYKMTLGMAELLATNRCRVGVLDREFNNPDHESCYSVGACDNCVRERDQDERRDRHASERQAKREEVELSILFYDGKDQELKHEKANSENKGEQQGNERKIFKSAIQSWRKKKIIELLDTMDLCKDAFMTDPELLRIAKSRKLEDISSFDHAEVRWPGQTEWRLELLALIRDVERSEQEKSDYLEREAQEKIRVAQEKIRLAADKRRLAEDARRQKQLERSKKSQAKLKQRTEDTQQSQLEEDSKE